MYQVQWFPGHMAKTRREVNENLNKVDIVLEIVDARLPESSRNPIIEELTQNKKSLIVLNKADLADPRYNQAWVDYYKERCLLALTLDAQHNKGLQAVSQVCKDLMADYFAKQKARGVKPRPIRLMVLGIPNVGKSTIINRFVGKNQAETGNKPGVTKAQRWLKINKDFELLDTPGILWPKFDDPATGLRLAISGAIKDQLLEMQELAQAFIGLLRQAYPQLLKDIYSLELEENQSDAEALMAFTRIIGMQDDYPAAGQRLIYDYRQGKLGRISLEFPPLSVKDIQK